MYIPLKGICSSSCQQSVPQLIHVIYVYETMHGLTKSIIIFVHVFRNSVLLVQDNVITTVKKDTCVFNKDLKILTNGATLISEGR